MGRSGRATATNTVVATVPVGAGPRAVDLAPNGYAYVTNLGSHTVSVIELAAYSVVATIRLGSPVPVDPDDGDDVPGPGARCGGRRRRSSVPPGTTRSVAPPGRTSSSLAPATTVSTPEAVLTSCAAEPAVTP